MQNADIASIGTIAVIVVLIVILIIAMLRRDQQRRDRDAEMASREIAIIIEERALSGFGGICVFLLISSIVVALFSYGRASTVFQQIEAGVGLIASTVVFATGAILGMRSNYRVLRSRNRE